jgi:hypothetical protein
MGAVEALTSLCASHHGELYFDGVREITELLEALIDASLPVRARTLALRGGVSRSRFTAFINSQGSRIPRASALVLPRICKILVRNSQSASALLSTSRSVEDLPDPTLPNTYQAWLHP